MYSAGDATREADAASPLFNTLRPITGHARAVYTAPGRGSEGGSREKLTQHRHRAWPRVASRTLPPTRYVRGAGPPPPPSWRRTNRAPIPLAWHGVLRYNCRMKKNGNGLLLDRILVPVSSSLNEEAAQKLLTLKADRKTQACVSKLADKCTEGELTREERHE